MFKKVIVCKGQNVTLFHIIKQHKRRKQRTILAINDPQGVACTVTTNIRKVFQNHLRDTYATMDQLQRNIPVKSTGEYSWLLDRPIMEHELLRALKKEGKTRLQVVMVCVWNSTRQIGPSSNKTF
jgi:hypothetical protein